MIKIEVQYFYDCPHASEAIEIVKRYKQEHPEAKVEFTQVQDNEQVKQVGCCGGTDLTQNISKNIGYSEKEMK